MPPRGQAADEANKAANTTAQQPPAGGAPAGGVQAGAPVSTAPSKLPTELQGKSAEEIAAYYSDRYKDYDDIKSRAEQYGGYEKLKLKPEQIENLNKWATDLLGGLSSGKRAALDPRTNQIVWIDEQGQQTTPPTQQQQADWMADWEMADPRQQADRMAGHIWNDQLTPRITELVNKYDGEIRNAVQGLDAKFNTFMDALELWQAHPELKIRDLLQRANERMKSNPGDLLRMTADDMLSPAQMEAKIQEEVAKRMAEKEAKWEAEHKAPPLGAPTGGSHRFGTETPKNKQEARGRFLNRSATGNAN